MSFGILIVDDDELTRSIIGQFLLARDCQFVEARNGDEAIDVLGHTDVDGVFLDILMPERDGYEFLSWARKAAPSIPVVVFTGANERADIDYARMAEGLGALMSFEKPVTSEKIDTALEIIRVNRR